MKQRVITRGNLCDLYICADVYWQNQTLQSFIARTLFENEAFGRFRTIVPGNGRHGHVAGCFWGVQVRRGVRRPES